MIDAPITASEMAADLWRIGDLRFKLDDGQLELWDWLESRTTTINVLHCARGYGKTWLMLCHAFATCIRIDNARVIYAAPTREQAKSIVIPTAGLIIEDAPAEVKPTWVAVEHAWIFPNGSRLIVDGADDERGNHLRGPFAHAAYGDEGAFWRHLLYVLKSVVLPIVQRRDGKIYVASSSPESAGHEFVGLMHEAQQAGSYAKRTIDENRRLTPKEREKNIAEMGGMNSTAARRELFCEIVTEAERAVVPEFNEAVHVGEPAHHPVYVDRYCAIDLGMTDLSHYLAGYYDFENALIVVQGEVAKQYSPVSDLAPHIVELERELWGMHRPHRRISDNEPMEIAEFGNQHKLQPDRVPYPLIFEPASNHEPEALINRARTMFKANRILISPKCVSLIHQLKVGIWNKRRTDFERIPGAGHLDGIMALAYLVSKIDYNRNPIPVDFGRIAGETWVPPHIREAERRRSELWSVDVRKLRV